MYYEVRYMYYALLCNLYRVCMQGLITAVDDVCDDAGEQENINIKEENHQ